MNAVTVDASVWVAAQDASDPLCGRSRAFLVHAAAVEAAVHTHAYARVEAACALARRFRSAQKGQRLTSLVFAAAHAQEDPVNAARLAKALSVGTARFLRGADALYSATADLTEGDLVSWDTEHIERAGALTPDDWVAANP